MNLEPPVPTDPQALARAEGRAELLRRIVWTAAIMVNALVLGLLVVTVLLIRNTQTEGSPTQKKLVAISQQIADCTNDAGKCAARQAKNTGKIVGVIDENTQRDMLAGLICQERLHTTSAAVLDRCMQDFLQTQ